MNLILICRNMFLRFVRFFGLRRWTLEIHKNFCAEESFILKESSLRMIEHSACIKLEPLIILSLGYTSTSDLRFFLNKFPDAKIVCLNSAPKMLKKIFHPRCMGEHFFLRRKVFRATSQSPLFVQVDVLALPLLGQADFFWANLTTLSSANPIELMGEWYSAMTEGAALIFSVFGPGTLQMFRRQVLPQGSQEELYHILGWPLLTLLDMHEYGDGLLNAGFENPVVDCDQLLFEYSSPDLLLQDLLQLSSSFREQIVQVDRPACVSDVRFLRLQLEKYFEGHRTITLDLELIFGHAWRPMLCNSKFAVIPIKAI